MPENPFELEQPARPPWQVGMASLVPQDPNTLWSPEGPPGGFMPLVNPTGAEGSYFTIDPAVLNNMWRPQPQPLPVQPPL